LLPRGVYEVRGETERKRVQIGAMAAHRMANAAWTEDDMQLTFLGTLIAYSFATRTDPFVNSARCTGAMALVAGLSRLPKPAAKLFERSIAEAESIDDLEGLTYAHYTRALYYATIGGNWRQVALDVERALDLTDKLGDVQERQITLVIAGMSRLLHGEFAAAGVAYRRLLDSALPRRHHEHVVWAYEGLTYSHLRQGHWEDAAETARHAHALLPRLQVGGVTVLDAALRAVFVPALTGEPDAAIAQLPVARKAIEALHVPFWGATMALDLFGDALDALLSLPPGEIDSAPLRAVEPVFVKGLSAHARRVPNAGAVALLHRARAAKRAGRGGRAVRLARSALERAVALGCPFDEARARLLLAELGDGGPGGALAHLEIAAAELERCGAAPHVTRCHAAEKRVAAARS
jgi:hypothetical protein